MKNFNLSIALFFCLITGASDVFAGWVNSPTDSWVISRAADCFVALGLHNAGTLSSKVIDLPLGESQIFFKILNNLQFGKVEIAGINKRFTSEERGSSLRSWRMWEYFAALLLTGAMNLSVEDYYNKLVDLSPHSRWTKGDQYGDFVARKFQDSVGGNRRGLVDSFVRAVFNKYCKIVADAKTRKIGAQAKIQKLPGNDQITSSVFKKLNTTVGAKPLYLSVWGRYILVSTSKVQGGTRVNDMFDSMVKDLYKDFGEQNSIDEIVGEASNNFATSSSFNAATSDPNVNQRFWRGLVLQTGQLIKALSDTPRFKAQHMCNHEDMWEDMWQPNLVSPWQNSGNGRDKKSNTGYKNAETSWLTFNGDGFNSPFSSKFGNGPSMFIDSPLLGVETPEKIAKYTGDGRTYIYGSDAQVYRSDVGPHLLRYRDACYDVSGSKNFVAIISGANNDNNNNQAYSPIWLQIKDTRTINSINTPPPPTPIEQAMPYMKAVYDQMVKQFYGPQDLKPGDLRRDWAISTTLACVNGIDTSLDDVNKSLENENKKRTSIFNSPITDAPYIGVPPGEKEFVMVEVGYDDAVWALCGSGVPYYFENNTKAKKMISPLQADLKFEKIAVGAQKAFRVLGITKTGELYVLVDSDLGLWNNTGIKGTHASVDDICNLAVIGLDDNIYKLVENDP